MLLYVYLVFAGITRLNQFSGKLFLNKGARKKDILVGHVDYFLLR